MADESQHMATEGAVTPSTRLLIREKYSVV